MTELNPETIYLSYLISAMSIEKLSEHYGLTVAEVRELIDRGRKINCGLKWAYYNKPKI